MFIVVDPVTNVHHSDQKVIMDNHCKIKVYQNTIQNFIIHSLKSILKTPRILL